METFPHEAYKLHKNPNIGHNDSHLQRSRRETESAFTVLLLSIVLKNTHRDTRLPGIGKFQFSTKKVLISFFFFSEDCRGAQWSDKAGQMIKTWRRLNNEKRNDL